MRHKVSQLKSLLPNLISLSSRRKYPLPRSTRHNFVSVPEWDLSRGKKLPILENFSALAKHRGHQECPTFLLKFIRNHDWGNRTSRVLCCGQPALVGIDAFEASCSLIQAGFGFLSFGSSHGQIVTALSGCKGIPVLLLPVQFPWLVDERKSTRGWRGTRAESCPPSPPSPQPHAHLKNEEKQRYWPRCTVKWACWTRHLVGAKINRYKWP